MQIDRDQCLFWLVWHVPFAVLCLAAQSCPTLCDPMDCSPPGSSVHGASPGKNTGVGCHALLQRESSQPRSPAVQADSLLTEPPWKPKNAGVGSLSLLQGIFPTQELNLVSCIAGRFFTSWATREALKVLYTHKLIWFSPFFMVQLSDPHMTTRKL